MDLLVNVNSLPPKYQNVFPKYRCFNRIQSAVYHHIFDSDSSIVVSAPTSSGKTVIFEMAIIRILMEIEAAGILTFDSCKIVMVAPMKAICNERYRDWKARFTYLNLKVLLLTGTTDTKYMLDLNKYNIIITTPEKWDSTMRQWNLHKDTIQKVNLFMIDEVQIVGDKSRGPTLEAIVSRMKNTRIKQNSLRIIAATAIASHLEDISEWLGSMGRPCRYFSFDESTRPVPLKTQVFGFPGNQMYFRFDMSLNYKLGKMVLDYSEKKPTLVFCSTRSGVEMAAKHLVQSLTATLTIETRKYLYELSGKLSHPQAKNVIKHGIGIHHAGILEEELQLIEDAFRREMLPVLVTTTTLAMGVNLPAHLVIIKGTKMYNNGEFQSYTDSQIQQMIGRAGRPQYDTSAVAIIMTTNEDKAKYHNMLYSTVPLESGLHLQLTEHLNSEIVLRSLTDIAMCMQWLTTTFLYVRASKNPHYYGLNAGLSEELLVRKLLQLCQIDINKLTTAGMVVMDENASLVPTFLGELMAKHYLQFETVKNLSLLRGTETMQDILQLVCKSKEFEDLYLRVSEKKVLNLLNESRTDAIRFPMTGKIKNVEMKANCLLQAVLGCLPITDHGLVVESEKVLKSADSIVRCMSEYLLKSLDKYSALYSTLLLSKSLKANLWENSSYVAKQLPGIGVKRARILAELGKTSFTSLALAGPNALNAALKSNIGENIIYLSGKIPKYEMTFKLKNGPLQSDAKIALLEITIHQTNKENLSESVVDFNSQMTLLVGNITNNHVVFHDKLTHSALYINDKYVKSIDLKIESSFEEVILVASFISSHWVGFDVTSEINVNCPVPSTHNNNSPPKIKQKMTILDYFASPKTSNKQSSSSDNLEIHEILSLNDQKDPEANIQINIALPNQKGIGIKNLRKSKEKINACDIFGTEIDYSQNFRENNVSKNMNMPNLNPVIKNAQDVPKNANKTKKSITQLKSKRFTPEDIIDLNLFPTGNSVSSSSCKAKGNQEQENPIRSKQFANNKFDPTLYLTRSKWDEMHNIDTNAPSPSELFAMFNIPTLNKTESDFGNKHAYENENKDLETIKVDSGLNSMNESERANGESSEIQKQAIFSIFDNQSTNDDETAGDNEVGKSEFKENVRSHAGTEYLNTTIHEQLCSEFPVHSGNTLQRFSVFNSEHNTQLETSTRFFGVDRCKTSPLFSTSTSNTQSFPNNELNHTFRSMRNNFLHLETTQSSNLTNNILVPKNCSQASINFEKKMRSNVNCNVENHAQYTQNDDMELSPKSFVSSFKGKSKFQNPSLLTQDDFKSNSNSDIPNQSLFIKATTQNNFKQMHLPSQPVLNNKPAEIINPSSMNISQMHSHIPFQSGYNNNGYTITQSKVPANKSNFYSIFRGMDAPSAPSHIPSHVYKKTPELNNPILQTQYTPTQKTSNYTRISDKDFLYLNSIACAKIPKYDFEKKFNYNATKLYDQPHNSSLNDTNALSREQQMEFYQTYLMNKHTDRSPLDDSNLLPYYASEYLYNTRPPSPSSPPAPYEFLLEKKPKLRHKLRPRTSGSCTVVCDVIKTSRKSIMWASPLVSEANLSSGSDSFTDGNNDSTV